MAQPDQSGVDPRWIERVQEVVTEAHKDNLGGKHRTGFCEACADAYLVAQVAVPQAAFDEDCDCDADGPCPYHEEVVRRERRSRSG